MTALTTAASVLAAATLAVRGAEGHQYELLVLLAPSPLMLTFLVTFPLVFIAAAQGFFGFVCRQRTDRCAFGESVYFYYGWRDAFRGRTRPWGALTRAEKLAQNPSRLGVRPLS